MLEQAFVFTAEELALNRSGKLSALQQDQLEQYQEVCGCGRKAELIFF